MNENYKFVDPEFLYTDPETGTLKNLAGINDPEALLFYESVVVAKRLQELYDNPIQIKGVQSLFEIHRHLFQDVYVWAGEERKVEIAKEGNPFFPTKHFDHAFKYIDSLISDFKKLSENDLENIARKLAEILDAVNHLHPFREGNGRAQREFIRLLALEKGIKLNLNPPDDQNVYERYMQGTIHGDINGLADLILELIKNGNA